MAPRPRTIGELTLPLDWDLMDEPVPEAMRALEALSMALQELDDPNLCGYGRSMELDLKVLHEWVRCSLAYCAASPKALAALLAAGQRVAMGRVERLDWRHLGAAAQHAMVDLEQASVGARESDDEELVALGRDLDANLQRLQATTARLTGRLDALRAARNGGGR